MTRTGLSVTCLLAVVGCGGGGTAKRPATADAAVDAHDVDAAVDALPVDAATDARPVDAPADAPSVCNVLTQSGCSSGEKCTWIIDMVSPSEQGHIGCAPDGPMAVGAACTRNSPGATGYDDCAKGNYCFGPASGGAGTCAQICDPAGGTPSCAGGYACSSYSGLFAAPGQSAVAGVCDPTCDPLADNNFLGAYGDNRTGSGCSSAGSAVGSGFLYTYGCYGLPDGRFGLTKWTCSKQVNPSRVHRTACDTAIHTGDQYSCANSVGNPYINGCASGYEPVIYDQEGSSQVDCLAMCRPADCYNTGSGTTAGVSSCGSGAGANITGTSPYQCTTARLQAVSFDAVDPTTTWSASNATVNNGEQCFYSWLFEFDTSGNLLMSGTSDTVGFCVDHAKYKFDPTGGSNSTTTWPRCDGIGMGSNGYGVYYLGLNSQIDAAHFGCVDTATARAEGDLQFSGKATFPRPELRRPYSATSLRAQ